ncbi:hypothetical protein B0H13DRAFT_1901674 [Mycena leptocephala]|nr:hypothetical protein B0H13DRAFT_1901674 [Mycena leptocephala]
MADLRRALRARTPVNSGQPTYGYGPLFIDDDKVYFRLVIHIGFVLFVVDSVIVVIFILFISVIPQIRRHASEQVDKRILVIRKDLLWEYGQIASKEGPIQPN